jgi:hypothetical protein
MLAGASHTPAGKLSRRQDQADFAQHSDSAADEIHRRLHTLGIRDRHIQAAMADRSTLDDTAAARALG